MGWMVNAKPQTLYPRRADTVPIVQEAEWAPGPVWKGAENLARTGILFLFSCTLYFIRTCFFVLIVLDVQQRQQHKHPCPRRDSNPQLQ